jgi:hypothetical protein
VIQSYHGSPLGDEYHATISGYSSQPGTVLPTAHSGFRSDYKALAGGPGAAASSRASADRIDLARVTADAVAWRVKGSTDISTEEREALLALLRSELQQRVQARPAQPLGRPAVLRAAITRVETVSPLLNTLSSLVLTIPLERGGAAMEIKAVDPQTGHQLAALTPGWRAPLTELMARFDKLAAAEIAIRKAAADFVLLRCNRRRMPGSRPHCAESIPTSHPDRNRPWLTSSP